MLVIKQQKPSANNKCFHCKFVIVIEKFTNNDGYGIIPLSAFLVACSPPINVNCGFGSTKHNITLHKDARRVYSKSDENQFQISETSTLPINCATYLVIS